MSRPKVRCFADIRHLPLFLGIVSMLWSTIPICEFDGSLFAKQLDILRIGQEWGWLMAFTGLYLVAGSVFRRRETLAIALLLSACAWTAMSIVFIDAAYRYDDFQWVTPVTLTMPAAAVTLWLSLVRELLAQPVVIKERRRVPRE